MPLYRVNLKSDEEQGATVLNNIYAGFGEGDIAGVSSNMEALFSARVVTVNEEYFRDYSLPYPDGNGRTWRVQMFGALGEFEQIYVPTIAAGSNTNDFATALETAGIWLPKAQTPATTINVMDYRLKPSF